MSYSNPDNYCAGQLPCMMKVHHLTAQCCRRITICAALQEGTYKPTGEILKSGKPLFHARFPGSHLFTAAGASESPVNLSLNDTISVERDWAVMVQTYVQLFAP